MKTYVEITKCYLVRVVDERGFEVDSYYAFDVDKKTAEKIGRGMKAEADATNDIDRYDDYETPSRIVSHTIYQRNY